MPRTARIILPNFPHHVIQRGHNRQVVFADDEDYQYYLNNLWEWKEKPDCRVYAYCLMTNHVKNKNFKRYFWVIAKVSKRP